MRRRLFMKQSAARATIIDSGIRSIQDFSPGGGDRRLSSLPSSPSTMSFISIIMCE
jgi:hypothetical protein